MRGLKNSRLGLETENYDAKNRERAAEKRSNHNLEDRDRTPDSERVVSRKKTPFGLAGGMNLYGFANGDPVNFSDPFGLCTIEDWADCKVFSFTVGAFLGIGFDTKLGPLELKGQAAKAGAEGSLSTGANGFHTHGAAKASAVSGSVRVGSRELEATLGSCSTDAECTAASVGGHHVEGASNGDISVTATAGLEFGVTFHAGETATAVAGVYKFVYDYLVAQAKKTLTKPTKDP